VDERGTVSPVLVLVLVGGVAALALAVELGRFASAAREVAFAADAGAEAGAARIDRAAAYAGEIRLDPVEAQAVAIRGARRARGRPGRAIEAAATEDRVCVTVGRTVEPGLLRAFGVGPWNVSASACAEPRIG
jgi:hypothetical protein